MERTYSDKRLVDPGHGVVGGNQRCDSVVPALCSALRLGNSVGVFADPAQFTVYHAVYPWVDRQIEQANRNLVSLLGNGKIRYCFDDKRLVMIGNQMAFDFPRQDVAAVRCYQKFGVWYLRNGLILIIPKGETMNDPSFKTLLNWNMTRS